MVDIKSIARKIYIEVKLLKFYLWTAFFFLVSAYCIFLFFDDSLIIKLYMEDGLFETLTAIFLLITSLLFLLIYFMNKHIIFMFLFLLFFFGFGEEISWGQRIFKYDTPESISEINIQHEFNIHNLEMLYSSDAEGYKKDGYSRWIDINIFYKLFYFSYFVLLPVLYGCFNFVRVIATKIKVPLPPVSMGFFIIVHLIVYYGIKFSLMQSGKGEQIFIALQEAAEYYTTSLFLILSVYFIIRSKTLIT